MSGNEADFFGDPLVVQDPAPYFAEFRAKCPVRREQHHGSVVVMGYEPVIDVLTRKDGSFSSCVSVVGPIPPLPFVPDGDDIRDQLADHRDSLPWSAHLVTFDGERHTAHRLLLTRLFDVWAIKAERRLSDASR